MGSSGLAFADKRWRPRFQTPEGADSIRVIASMRGHGEAARGKHTSAASPVPAAMRQDSQGTASPDYARKTMGGFGTTAVIARSSRRGVLEKGLGCRAMKITFAPKVFVAGNHRSLFIKRFCGKRGSSFDEQGRLERGPATRCFRVRPPVGRRPGDLERGNAQFLRQEGARASKTGFVDVGRSRPAGADHPS